MAAQAQNQPADQQELMELDVYDPETVEQELDLTDAPEAQGGPAAAVQGGAAQAEQVVPPEEFGTVSSTLIKT